MHQLRCPRRRQRRCLGDSSHRLYSRPGYDDLHAVPTVCSSKMTGMRDEFRRMMVVLYFKSLPNFRRYFFARLVLLKLWYLYVPGCMSTVCFADTYCYVRYCVKTTQYPMVFHSMTGEGLCGSQPLQPLGPIVHTFQVPSHCIEFGGQKVQPAHQWPRVSSDPKEFG